MNTIYTIKTVRTIAGLRILSYRRKGGKTIVPKSGADVPRNVAFYLQCIDHAAFDWDCTIVPELTWKNISPEIRDELTAAITAPAEPDGILIRRTELKGRIYWTLRVKDDPKVQVYSDRTVKRCVKYAQVAAFGYAERVLPVPDEFGRIYLDDKNSEIYLNVTNSGVTFSPSMPGDATYEVTLDFPFSRKDADDAVANCRDYAEWYFKTECGCEKCGHGEGELGGWILNPDCPECEGCGIA